MKRIILLLYAALITAASFAQAPTNVFGLRFPMVVDTVYIKAGANNGTMFFNQTSQKLRLKKGGVWVTVGEGGGGGGGGAVASVFGRTGAVVAAIGDYTFAQISSTPTTLSGYGITDPIVLTSGSYSNPAWITALAWSKLTSTPTTLSGYGITDAVPSSRTINSQPLSSNITLTPSNIGLSNVDNTSDVNKPISTAQAAVNTLKAPLASPVFTGTVTFPTPFTLGAVSVTTTGTQLNYLNAATGTTGTNKVVLDTAPTITGANLVLASDNVQTASYTFVAGDVGKRVIMNVATANTLTLPTNAAVPYAINTELRSRRTGAGQTTVVAPPGGSVTGSAGNLLDAGQNTDMVLTKTGTNTWDLSNGTAPLTFSDGVTQTGLSVVIGGALAANKAFTGGFNMGFQQASPTARIHAGPGSATANTAPFKFTSGTNLTTPEAGAFEFDGTVLSFTPSTVRLSVMIGLSGTTTIDIASIAANTTSTTTATITGAAVGDPCYVGVTAITAGTIFTCQITATNTATIYVTNPTASPLDPPSATYSVRAIKTP